MNAKSDTDLWASDWKFEEVWVSVQRRRQTLKKAGSGHFELLSKSIKTSGHHDTNPTHTLSHMPHARAHKHAHTQRSVRVGYMRDPYTQVHDVQLTSDSQLIGKNKNDGLKRNKTKQKDHNSASIKWPLSRSTYQHFLGCWLIDKCCQSHTENKMKQKLQNDSVFSQNFLSPLLQ